MQITSDQSEAEQALTALGFTVLEARVYCALLASGPATGYRLARPLGRRPPGRGRLDPDPGGPDRGHRGAGGRRSAS
ncbi:helix-turn-helix domain-containing protein [Brevundimonas sp.]|uniref:helix-turn-helix domain-containing protein n=1 Tax=Brevundimonas sp. TaxID=1871086 RepID=UPI0039C86CA3